ncbi:unnamed protein product [Toxocara canis]|uniref:Uncharacterized protein n=1 Tax=Toxocara canis TaxID=6265 RepID=A0A183V6Y3_TOXCA|nr:unnamed protein product [Toxocara canis]
MNILEQINTRIVDENARIRRENFLFRLNCVRVFAEQQLRQRIMKEQPSVAATTTAAAALWQRIRSLLAGQRLIVSAFEETLAILSIESLCMLVWHSYEEDRYGVVQNDLNAIISQMLQLVVSLDRYIHHIRSVDYIFAIFF